MRRFAIVGIVNDEAIFGLGDAPIGKVFVPLKTVQQMRDLGDWVGMFALELDRHDADGVDDILADVERKYRTLKPGTEPMYLGRQQAEDGTRIVGGLLYAMVSIVAAVGVVGILNTQVLNVLERRREIGVLRSLGALRKHLVRFFLVEGIVLSGLGFLVGVPAGWVVARLLVGIISAALITLQFTVPAADIALSLLFALVLSVIAGLLPALAAARLKVAEVLRYA
jgi:putative ABC transport system permease protein